MDLHLCSTLDDLVLHVYVRCEDLGLDQFYELPLEQLECQRQELGPMSNKL